MPGREVGGILLVDSHTLGGTPSPSALGHRSAAAAGSAHASWQVLGGSVPFENVEGATVVTQLEKKNVGARRWWSWWS